MTNITWQTRAALKGSAATFVLTIAMISGAAHAQTAATTTAETAAVPEAETIVVTGSLIRNPALERSSPVTVTSAADIELMGSNTAEEILREIPGIVPSIGSAVNNGNGGASFVDLRGLGPNRNIVLLDGTRLTPAELNGRFDLNNIPLALVERVDVLTGGASTTYGADAISGVVNFVTKRDFAGAEITASNQITERGDGNAFRIDAVIGANFDDGRGNVVLGIGYQKTNPVFQGDRDFSRFQYDSFSGASGGSGTSAPTRFTGVNTSGGDFIAEDCGEPGLPACVTGVQGNRQVTSDGTAFRGSSAFDAFNFNPFNVFQVPFRRYNVYAAGRYELNDAVELYSRAIFSKNTVETIIAPGGAFGVDATVNLNNPYLTTAQRNGFCQFDTEAGVGYVPLFTPGECAAAATATGPGDPNYRTVDTIISRRAVEGGTRNSEFTTTYFDYQIGARGAITSNMDWDLNASYGESENTQVSTGFYLSSRVRQSVLANSRTDCQDSSNGCVPVNFFGPIGAITPEMNQFLYAPSSVVNKFAMTQVKGTISGDFGFTLGSASNPIAFAIGGEYRNYSASQESDLVSQSGDLSGSGGAALNIDGGYRSYEALAEIVVPLVQDRPFFEDLTIEAGVRYSKYDVDAPSNPSYETWTYKAGGSWSPGAGFKVRGNYSRAVRAPNIAELFTPVNTLLTNLADDPCANLDDEGAPIAGRPVPAGELRAICIAQGGGAALGAIGVPTAGQANFTGGGSLDLLPEKSDSWTLGVVWQPTFVPGLSITVDYYNIKVTDAITAPTPGDAINACFGFPDAAGNYSPAAGASATAACTDIRRNTTTGQLSGDASTTPGLFLTVSNQGRLATDGVDFSLNYGHDFDWTRWALAVNGNWTNSSTFQSKPGAINRECVGVYSVNCSANGLNNGSIIPDWQFSVRNTLTFGDIDLSLLWRYISRVEYEDGDAFSGALRGGNLAGEEVDFNFIPAYHMFDFSARASVGENLTLTLGIQNLFDKQPKNVGNTIGSTSFNSGNVYPSTYDALGRRYAVTARFRF